LENQKERDYLGDLKVGGGDIKIYVRRIGYGGKDWIYLAQNRD
jgi:hypothetical protein